MVSVIKLFLTEKDWRQVTACTREWKDFRVHSMYLSLETSCSLIYYKDEEFRKRVLGAVANPRKQISLVFNHGFYQIRDVSVLKDLHSLNLCYCENITDVSPLENVHSLNLAACKITDVSALGKCIL